MSAHRYEDPEVMEKFLEDCLANVGGHARVVAIRRKLSETLERGDRCELVDLVQELGGLPFVCALAYLGCGMLEGYHNEKQDREIKP